MKPKKDRTLMKTKELYMHMHTHTPMVKVISLSETAYKELKEKKRNEESFSDVVIRLIETEKRPSILELAGKWPGTKKEVISLKKELEAGRKRFKLRGYKL